MNLKHTALIILFFMCLSGCGTLFWSKSDSVEIRTPIPGEDVKQEEKPIPDPPPPPPPPPPPAPSNARLMPVTWDIVNDTQNFGVNLKDLRYYLSKPFSMTITERNNAPRRFEASSEGTLIVSREQNIPIRRIEFPAAGAGTLRTVEESSEIFIIVFRDTLRRDIPLRFKKNSQGLYDLHSVEIEARTYNLGPEDEFPQLCIFVELNEHLEVRAISDSIPDDNKRDNADRDQRDQDQPDQDQPDQDQRDQDQPGNSAAVPSTKIMDRGSVTERGIIEYIRSKPRSPALSYENIELLIGTYFREADSEGVNRDIAIAQMLFWTDSLRNQERVRSNNYGGLSANGLRWNGRFPNIMTNGMTEGVRAHIQHLKFYASTVLNNNAQVVDPRYQVLENLNYLGTVSTFDQLYVKWSPYNSVGYKNRIDGILDSLYRFSANYR